jgi:large subunit ribosomal protein L32
MAALAAPIAPRLLAPSISNISRWATFYTARFTPKLFPTLAIALPSISLNIPQLLDDIWSGILNAAPKKKTSHSKKRHRQMAGKALEDVNHLCKCPGCGATKRTHRLCQRCLEGQSTSRWLNAIPNANEISRDETALATRQPERPCAVRIQTMGGITCTLGWRRVKLSSDI